MNFIKSKKIITDNNTNIQVDQINLNGETKCQRYNGEQISRSCKKKKTK